MCEVVEISDDEDAWVPKFVPGGEGSSRDSHPQETCLVAGEEKESCSSRGDWRSFFAGMGFEPALVEKVMEENGERDAENLLESLIAYSNRKRPKTEPCDNDLSSPHNDDLTARRNARQDSSDSPESLFRMINSYHEGDFHAKEEPDESFRIIDEKISSLLRMDFSLAEVEFAMVKLGKSASLSQLKEFIISARMAKKYENGTSSPSPRCEESKWDGSNEELFSIMEKTLQLLDMGFSECQISTAFEMCGPKASLLALTNSIVAPDSVTGTDSVKYYTSSNIQIKMEDSSLRDLPPGSFHLKKEEEYDLALPVGISELLEKSKGKKLKEVRRSVPKKPKKVEFSQDLCIELKQFDIDEDGKPVLLPKPSRLLSNAMSKRPYFFYGSTADLPRSTWAKVSQFLYSIQPEFADTRQYSALHRIEGYVHNLPTEDRFQITPKGPMSIDEAFPNARKWKPSWDNRKHIVFPTDFDSGGVSYLCDRIGRQLAGSLSPEQQRNIVLQLESKNLIWVGNNKLSPLEPENLELVMGFPLHHSRISGFSSANRLNSLKQSFQTDTVGHHLSVLRRLFPDGVSILSFFTGLGASEIALHRLEIPLKCVVSMEPREAMRGAVKRWWKESGQGGELVQMEGAEKLSGSKLEGMCRKYSGFDLVAFQNPWPGGDGFEFDVFMEFVRVFHWLRCAMERKI